MKMLNAQVSSVNECINNQWINELNHLNVAYSLSIEHCHLNIQGGAAV